MQWRETIDGTIDSNFVINYNYYGNRVKKHIQIKVSTVVTIDGKITINGKFCATGPRWYIGLQTSVNYRYATNSIFLRLLFKYSSAYEGFLHVQYVSSSN